MADRFTAQGKEVLLDGAHYADAVNEAAAVFISEALEYQIGYDGSMRALYGGE